jgi:transposase
MFASKVGTTRMNKTSMVAGIDVAKNKLDIAVPAVNEAWTAETTPEGLKALTKRLHGLGVTIVALEASGGYERNITEHLRAAGLDVLRLQPKQVKDFARARLRRAKNDTLDAALIAECATVIGVLRDVPDARLEALADQLTFIEQIDEDIVRCKTRLEHTQVARLRSVIEADIKKLERRRKAEIARIVRQIEAHSDLARRFELIQSVPGIGPRTALTLLIRMPELGRISREEAAALAGLAPFDDDSGKRNGARRIAGGRGRVRKALYAAALAAAFRWNKALKTFYQRLIGKGKKHKSALVACARKLLIYANAVLERDAPWTEAKA